jgi:hypothetical protein
VNAQESHRHVDSAPKARATGKLGFLIVGSPRSGTTLVQRLACELEGVRVPPETHFFRRFGPGLLRRQPFPIDGPSLIEVLERFARLETSAGMQINPVQIVEELGGACHSLVELFEAIVRHLAGPAALYGEKTPKHLYWWLPLTRAVPDLKLVAVVRDPRAVVASSLRVSWGRRSLIRLAERWASDQREVARATAILGPSRFLVLRYEDVVVDPASAYRALGGFLHMSQGRSNHRGQANQEVRSLLFVPRERTWKGRAADPITPDRLEAWRSFLSPKEAAIVGAICQRGMRRFGYRSETPGSLKAAFVLGRLHPRAQAERVLFRRMRRRYQRGIERTML